MLGKVSVANAYGGYRAVLEPKPCHGIMACWGVICDVHPAVAPPGATHNIGLAKILLDSGKIWTLINLVQSTLVSGTGGPGNTSSGEKVGGVAIILWQERVLPCSWITQWLKWWRWDCMGCAESIQWVCVGLESLCGFCWVVFACLVFCFSIFSIVFFSWKFLFKSFNVQRLFWASSSPIIIAYLTPLWLAWDKDFFKLYL